MDHFGMCLFALMITPRAAAKDITSIADLKADLGLPQSPSDPATWD